MLAAMRAAFRLLTTVLFVAVVGQVALAGYGAFRAVHDAKPVGISQKSIEHGFSAHIALGYVIVVVMLVMLLVAVLGQQQPIRVKMVGGLFVLGTERHESRRIDNQLRGRTGRQGEARRSPSASSSRCARWTTTSSAPT